jgi:hypothetical protein
MTLEIQVLTWVFFLKTFSPVRFSVFCYSPPELIGQMVCAPNLTGIILEIKDVIPSPKTWEYWWVVGTSKGEKLKY